MNTQSMTNTEELKELEHAKIDFKMVTFTLGGKDYGIDIMKVKEINKAQKFTFVPNSAPFVKGVYNMRGDIISVIDLRVFFNLPIQNKNQGFENMIILRLEENTIGILVDSIDKVIGIDSSRKQAPHPLFGDINIKYIDAVVENESSLYIILDAEKIFSADNKADKAEETRSMSAPKAAETAPSYEEEALPVSSVQSQAGGKALNLGFIEETLPTYAGFYPSNMNREWLSRRYDSWISQKGEDFQLNSKEDAAEYLRGFNSSCSGQLWSDGLIEAIKPHLPVLQGNALVWNPGCGRGYETYSIAALLKDKNPDAVLKVQGNDNDLINISSAPGLTVDKQKSPTFYEPFLVEGNSGTQFNETIKDSVIFEYSDLNNDASFPPMDMIVCRDTLCYLEEADQLRTMDMMYEYLKPAGLLILGDNEEPISESGWELVENKSLKIYKKV